jgi:hypothetical protein
MESIGNTTIQTLPAPESSDFDAEVHIFRGTPQVTTGYSYINTIITATGKGKLKIHHSIDGIVWAITDTYEYPAVGDNVNEGLFNITTAKALYFMVEFENTATDEDEEDPVALSNNIRLQTFLRLNM